MIWKMYRNSRLVHININATIAGILSLIISSYLVFLTYYITDDTITIVLLSYAIDGIVDFTIFATLHAIVYRKWFRKLSFTKMLANDIIDLQTQRILFTAVTFVVGAGVQFGLMHFSLSRTISFIIAYLLAILATRGVHTIYGLKKGLFKPLHIKHKVKALS